VYKFIIEYFFYENNLVKQNLLIIKNLPTSCVLKGKIFRYSYLKNNFVSRVVIIKYYIFNYLWLLK